jgi:hypothetical protein
MEWTNLGGAEWLVSGRDEETPAVAGVTVAGGYLAQPANQPGIAPLTAAWLIGELSRPVEAVDLAAGRPAKATCVVASTHVTFAFGGAEAAVAVALERFDRLVADGPAEITEEVRQRARLISNPLNPWSVHLAVRWGGAPVTLAALPALALDDLDPVSVLDHLRGWYVPSQRVFWTNEPKLPGLVDLREVGGQPRGLPDPPRAYRIAGRGTVLLRDGRELASMIAPASPAGEVAMRLVFDALHRRLVDLEPLAADLYAHTVPVHGRSTLFGLVLAESPVDRPLPTLVATAQTLEGLAADPGPDHVLAEARDGLADEYAGLLGDPDDLTALARRRLVLGDRRDQDEWAAALLAVSTADIGAAIAELAATLLLAAPPGTRPEELPYPIVERLTPLPATGRRYPARYGGRRQIRASPDRLGAIRPDRRRDVATTDCVEYADVALRIDIGEQTTVLIDGHLDAMPVTWPLVRRARRLRAAVDAATAAVPVLRLASDPAVDAQVASLRRRSRRRWALGMTALLVLAAWITVGQLRAAAARRPVVLPAARDAVRLGNGTVVGPLGPPELRPGVLSVQVRLCGGEPAGRSAASRNGAGPASFAALTRTGTPLRAAAAVLDRPALGPVDLARGQCVTGWLAYRTSTPAPYRLRYRNPAGDDITWPLRNLRSLPR